jgi:hypothetical protein|uniref:porin family protein n=1 Tax=Prevotella sp. TaxID=59823 RepID=UPI003FF0D04C
MRKIILGALLATISLGAWAGEKDQAGGSAWNRFLHGYRYYAHVGYHIGGTAPIEMPASIRTLHSYRLRPNFVLGVDAYHAISGRWGFVGGLHFEEKAMRTDAGVKGYHMRIVRGGEELEGVFTGSVVTKVDMSLITVPLQIAYDLSPHVRLKAGPYVSYVTSRKFEGWAYDGYLRRREEGHDKHDPTGQKVMLGHNDGERGNYDFSDDMRSWQMGIDVGADWYITKRWGAKAGLSWGLTGIFHSGFDTIEQTMYPIYGTIGVVYQLK